MDNSTIIPVYGMSCAKCERKVQQALLDLPQVLEASADHTRDCVRILFVPSQPLLVGKKNSTCDESAEDEDLIQVKQTIRDQGYQLEAADLSLQHNNEMPAAPSTDLTTFLLDVGGMSCASCVVSVEKALMQVPGVTAANVNYANSSVLISAHVGEPKHNVIEHLIAAVTKAGYSARQNQNIDSVQRSAELKQQLASSAARSIVALVAASGLMLNARWDVIPESTSWWLMIGILVLGIMATVGGRYYKGAWFALRQGRATMDSLIALGTGAAWLFSMVAIIFPSFVPLGVQSSFFEAGLFVIGFVHLGKSIEEYARGNTSMTLYALLGLQPTTTLKVTSQGDELVGVDSIIEGDQLCIRAGESIPLDGVVVSGTGEVNEQMLTGETAPMIKTSGDKVTGGTVNVDGTLIIRVTETGENTVLARMVAAVKRAQNSKPPIGHLADQISAIFVPFVIVTAAIAACIWWWLVADVQYSFTVFMTVLIIACPCALGLAIPLSIVVGIGRAASLGIVVGHSDALQKASKLDVVVLDKTGTLTQGKPEVACVVLAEGESPQQLADIALSLEAKSLHPLALAIIEYFSTAKTHEVVDHYSVPGSGITGQIDGKLCCLGNYDFLIANDFADVELAVPENGSHVYVGFENRILGVIVAQDQIRETSSCAVSGLISAGIEVVLLSGDREEVVAEVTQALGITQYRAQLSPVDKQIYIAQRQQRGEVVAMVGDGINDALALSQADVGFAMGAGSDIAIESADMTLMSSDLLGVKRAIVLSKKIMANIRQNLLAAFAYNIALIPVAAGVLYPFFDTLLNPGLAGLAMALSSLTVVANAGRLRLMA